MDVPATGPSRLPGAPYKDFVDELLADIDVRGYRLSPEREAFVDDLLYHCPSTVYSLDSELTHFETLDNKVIL